VENDAVTVIPELLPVLRGIVGESAVLSVDDVTAGYLRDWTGRFGAPSGVVVRPRSVDEVAQVLHSCAAAGVAVIPQGGNTGLVGASVPLAGEVVLSLRRLSDVSVDAVAGQVLAGAGATIGAVQSAARQAGWAYGVDLASRDSCTVGGTIATNAGGLRVLRYGDTRRQVMGVEAVLSDGTVLSHLSPLTRDNTGYSVPALLAGSEGTLAVITRARMRLVAPPVPSAVAVLGFGAVDDAARSAGLVRRTDGLSAVELFLPAGVELVRSVVDLPALPPAAAYLLIERDGDADGLASAVADLPGVVDAAVADDAAGRASLWSYRERHTESIATLGPVVKLDVTLPLDRAADYLDAVDAVVTGVAPGGKVWLFGHLADGNVHTNVTGVPEPDVHAVEDAVLRLVADLGGSIASEHGIGVAKREWLPLNRSAAEIDTFRRLKSALDPAGILSPATLLP
jgi:FAD/FMN-containing dehydrogenase